MALVATDAWNQVVLADLVLSGAVLKDTLQVGLFTNNLTINNQTTLSNLVEANFDGYARQSPGTWSGLLANQDGSWSVNSELVAFSATDGTVPNTIYGYFVHDTSSSSTVLLFCELFSTPVQIAKEYDGVKLVLNISTGGDNWGSATVIT